MVATITSAALAAIELSPAFQSRGSGYAVISVAERRFRPIGELNRRSATEDGCALIVPALKSRAKLTWSLRDRGNGYRVITNATNKMSHNPTRNCGRLYQVKFICRIEGGKYGSTKSNNTNQTEHHLHHG